MCWSGEASTVLAMLGLGTTAYAAYKKDPPVLWMTLGYFSLMEALQAYTYAVIDRCDHPGNQIATLLGYLHIVFQPFFINAISLYFVPERIQKAVRIPVYTLCFVSAILMLIQLYPFDWAGACVLGSPLCGPQLCSVHGNWHIAWQVPSNGIFGFFENTRLHILHDGYPTYALVAILLPLFYGSWKFTVYHYVMGPFAAALTTNNPNEWPAVWCLLSIGFLLIVLKTPLRQWLHVQRWVLWPKRMETFS